MWRYCVVGNIIKSHLDEDGIIHYGTSSYVGGTKVYLCGKHWLPSQKEISVIGLSRGKRYYVDDVPIGLIENIRCQRTYKPAILNIMGNFEYDDCWWSNTKEDKEATEAFVASIKEHRKDEQNNG